MKKGSVIFLKIVILFIGAVVLIGLIRFPLTEGRAVNLDLIQIYFDPVIVYMYIASIPFFAALYQAFRLLGYIKQNKVFSLNSIRSLRAIKYCALAIIGFIVLGEAYLIVTWHGNDDITGPISLGIIITFIAIVVTTAAAVFEKLLQSAVDLKSENDLTV